jgi:hypothetical protein
MNMPASPHAEKKTIRENAVRRAREDMLREILRLPFTGQDFSGAFSVKYSIPGAGIVRYLGRSFGGIAAREGVQAVYKEAV